MVRSAIGKGFSALGFSSHAQLPGGEPGNLTAESALRYADEIRSLGDAYRDVITLSCGVEAEYTPGYCAPDREDYAAIKPDYIIGSVHYVVQGTRRCPVDHTPELLARGIAEIFDGDAERFVRAYFAQIREMARTYDFDIVGHADLVRKFNARHPFFDETAAWYAQEIGHTADVLAASGKIVELNTGAISRGWLDDAYPAKPFRDLLRARGARFILSADAHAADALDCAFDRFARAETFVSSIAG
jgi:histidinol-phosphatase (PHP family)